MCPGYGPTWQRMLLFFTVGNCCLGESKKITQRGDGDEGGEARTKTKEGGGGEGIGTHRPAPNSPLLHRLQLPGDSAAPDTESTSSPSSSIQNPTQPNSAHSSPSCWLPLGRGALSGERRRRAGEIGSAGPRAGVALGDDHRIGCSLTPPAAA